MSSESAPLIDPDGLVGRVLAERYLLEQRLGEGGMGSVYRADRKSTRLNSSHNPASRMPSSA
jgi:serine/threonine protein kinase